MTQYTKRILIIIPMILIGIVGTAFAITDTKTCDDKYTNFGSVICFLKLQVSQNDQIINQNEKMIKLLERNNCLILNKEDPYYDMSELPYIKDLGEKCP